MGQQLYDEFQPGQTELDGVPLPYPGWVEQMTGCAPTVAQALAPYPQYCSPLFGQNENAGNSTFHSLQLKAEHRFSKGAWLLASYTLAKLITSTDSVQADATLWSGAYGVISPYERKRNKALALNDVPQTFSLAMIYELPFGRGKRFANSTGPVDRLISGWQLGSILRITSGVPFPSARATAMSPVNSSPAASRRFCQEPLHSHRRRTAVSIPTDLSSTRAPLNPPIASTSIWERDRAFRIYAASATTTRISTSSRTRALPSG